MSDDRVHLEFTVHLNRGRHGKVRFGNGAPAKQTAPPGRVPRVARLMALALRLDELVRSGAVADYAELARLGHVTRARMSQIMNLLNLAPDIQEQVLFLPRVASGRDPVRERDLRPIAALPDWQAQRRLWKQLLVRSGVAGDSGEPGEDADSSPLFSGFFGCSSDGGKSGSGL